MNAIWRRLLGRPKSEQDQAEAEAVLNGLNDAKQLNRLNEKGECPDCGSHWFHPGPRGGAAENIKCAHCGSKFCYCPPFNTQRIDNDDSLYSPTPQEFK